MSVSRKYGFLRVIAFILKALAWLILLAGIAVPVLGLTTFRLDASQQPLLAPLLALGIWIVPLIAVVWFIQLFAFGSIISLLIDVEENTRALAALPPE